MITIHIDIKEDIIQKAGKNAIKEYLQKQVNLLQLRILGDEISTAMDESKFDMEQELKTAQKEAWEEYKSQYLNGILK